MNMLDDYWADKIEGPDDVDPVEDMVNSPSHYNTGDIECIDAIRAMLGDRFKDYCLGNVAKYIWRHDYKGKAIEDLRKADWYLQRAMEALEQ